MAMFGRARDVSLFRHVNRELINNIVTQQIGYYKYKLEATEDNLYGETPERYFTDPVLLNWLIVRGDQEWAASALGSDFGPDESRTVGFNFLRDDLKDANIVPEVGDIVLYQEAYYGVDSTVANQYWGGKNPDYPNNDSDGTPNPLNPNLQLFGNNVSILVSTYYIPADKVAISPYKERF